MSGNNARKERNNAVNDHNTPSMARRCAMGPSARPLGVEGSANNFDSLGDGNASLSPITSSIFSSSGSSLFIGKRGDDDATNKAIVAASLHGPAPADRRAEHRYAGGGVAGSKQRSTSIDSKDTADFYPLQELSSLSDEDKEHQVKKTTTQQPSDDSLESEKQGRPSYHNIDPTLALGSGVEEVLLDPLVGRDTVARAEAPKTLASRCLTGSQLAHCRQSTNNDQSSLLSMATNRTSSFPPRSVEGRSYRGDILPYVSAPDTGHFHLSMDMRVMDMQPLLSAHHFHESSATCLRNGGVEVSSKRMPRTTVRNDHPPYLARVEPTFPLFPLTLSPFSSSQTPQLESMLASGRQQQQQQQQQDDGDSIVCAKVTSPAAADMGLDSLPVRKRRRKQEQAVATTEKASDSRKSDDVDVDKKPHARQSDETSDEDDDAPHMDADPSPRNSARSTEVKCSTSQIRDQWHDRYLELQEFKRRNGHCNVPFSYQESPFLGAWVKRQRYQYKCKLRGDHSQLTDERQRSLEKIGFVFDTHAGAWEEKYAEMVEFHRKHGHCQVPIKYKELNAWSKRQRRHYKQYLIAEGDIATMNEDRVRRLNEIGFSWQASSSSPPTNESISSSAARSPSRESSRVKPARSSGTFSRRNSTSRNEASSETGRSKSTEDSTGGKRRRNLRRKSS